MCHVGMSDPMSKHQLNKKMLFDDLRDICLISIYLFDFLSEINILVVSILNFNILPQ